MHLTTSQSAALNYIEAYAQKTPTLGLAELDNVLAMSNITKMELEAATQQIKEHAQVGLHFHPDRLAKGGRTVAEWLLEDGYYRSQFETHLSNGKLDPTANGQRADWENDFFGGVFDASDAKLSERPKYGALALMQFSDGPSPRYGSCYFLLNPSVSQRSTFSYMDSHRNPVEKGTLTTFMPILAALMTECFERRFALGKSAISPSALVKHLCTQLRVPLRDRVQQPRGRNLNHYIEAQVHGNIDLLSDVDILVADPSFRGTLVEEQFKRLSAKFEIELFWHQGFKLPLPDVPDDFRGPTMPSLAARISTSDYVDAFMIGAATVDLKQNPTQWADLGSHDEVLQELKCLWHVLVQYGV